ncbi:MAG TPA: STAS domain-containing protein [Rhodocyclaceae bacterium]|nr:STAS domain-containing protein [Rhodocyclaceae bacterium]
MTDSASRTSSGGLEFADGVLRVRGSVKIGNAQHLADAGALLIKRAGAVTVDLTEATEVDSAALAVLFAWQRVQQMNAATLAVRAAPETLHSLARVYGVSDQLTWI